MPPEPWFDENHPKISEDSDLNFRIIKSGGNIFIDSDIRVKYFCRETLLEFFILCYNYGVGRGLFAIKHSHFSAWRQMVLPLSFFILTLLFGFGFFDYRLHIIFFFGILSYLGIIGGVTLNLSRYNWRAWGLLLISFIGCHFFWTVGFFNSIRIYKKGVLN